MPKTKKNTNRKITFLDHDDAFKVEQALIQVIFELSLAAGYDKQSFAHKVWPTIDSDSARTKWYHIRKKSWRTGRPQGLLIADAERMANILERPLEELLEMARDAIK